MLIFFHVPKAAGTTFREMLRLEISASKVLNLQGSGGISFMTDDDLNSMDLISGHVGIDLLKRIHRPHVSITILRDPVSRVVSQYRYIRAQAKEGRRYYFSSNRWLTLSLSDVLRDEDPFIESTFRNTQAWFFTSDWPATSRDRSLCDQDVLDRAKENIERLDYFGIVEDLDLSYRAMNRKFHWALVNNAWLNRSEGDELEMTSELVEQIQSENRLDVELYAWAKKRFYEKTEQILADGRFASILAKWIGY